MPGPARGVAEICVSRVDRTSNAELASATLITLMGDEDDDVPLEPGIYGIRDAIADAERS